MSELTDMVEWLVLEGLKGSYQNVLAVDPDPKLLKALKRVIKFYSTPDQYEEWKEGLNEPI